MPPAALAAPSADPAASPALARWPVWAAAGVLALLGAAALLPQLRSTTVRLSLGVSAAAFALWLTALVWRRRAAFRRGVPRSAGLALQAEVVVRRPHWVQMITHSSVYAYWGWHVDLVYPQVPLILAQVVFAYALDLLLSWTRGRRWVVGFGPVPIVGSTNLFLWFRDDFYFLQLAMVAAALLSREWLRWRREGQQTHIFNPSGFGLSLASVLLIATGTTDWTWGAAIATTLGDAPYMYECIFLAGLVVQLLFGVGLVTLSAVVTVFGGTVLVHALTGFWPLENDYIPIAVFLGMHLLVTDPATSPRGNGAKVLFGALYGLAVFPLYWGLLALHTPAFYDKLLQVPVLNLLVPWLERAGRHLRWPRWPLGAVATHRLHLALWCVLFLSLRGDLRAHPASAPDYWEARCTEAVAAGADPTDTRACANVVQAYGRICEQGQGAACARLGGLFAGGGMLPPDEGQAVAWFERACAHDAVDGCAWLALAREQGRGNRPPDPRAAEAARLRACALGDAASCLDQAARYLDGRGGPRQPQQAVDLLSGACQRDLAPACGVLGFVRAEGRALPRDLAGARAAYDRACALGLEAACAQRAALPEGR